MTVIDEPIGGIVARLHFDNLRGALICGHLPPSHNAAAANDKKKHDSPHDAAHNDAYHHAWVHALVRALLGVQA